MSESRRLCPIPRFVLILAALPALAAAQQYKFSQPLSLPSNGFLALQVETADFNEDGYDDFAVLNLESTASAKLSNVASSSISVYLSNGDGTFANPATYTLPCPAFSFRARPLATKGPVSLIAVCATSNQIVVYAGAGDGTFATPAVTQLSSNILGFTDVLRFAMEDFNGDGNLDLAYIALSSNLIIGGGSTENVDLVAPVQIAFGNGDGTFGNSVTLPGVTGVSISPGDFNADGNYDLVVSSPPSFDLAALSDSSLFPQVPGNIEILLGDGHGNFTLKDTYGVSFSPLTQTVGDVNGDGIPDIVLTGFGEGPAVFLGKGDGSFTQAPAANDLATGHAAIADLRSSGMPDIILPLQVTTNGSSAQANPPVILPGNGDGTFGTAVQFLPSSFGDASVAVGDFDGNGTPDLVFAVIPVDINNLGNSSAPGPGTVSVLINQDPRTVNAASFATGAVATESIAALFGVGLAARAVPNTAATLGTTLGGVTLTVQDSAGTSRPAPLFYVSPKQVNFEVPAGTATGAATITVNNAGSAITMTKQITTLAPGIFELNAGGLVAAIVDRLKGGNANDSVTEKIYQVSGNQVVALPLDLGVANGDQVYLEVFGTGIRNAKTVTATLGGVGVSVHYHGASGDVGEDQVNIGPIPSSLAGKGSVRLQITADGLAANPVNLTIK